MRQLEKNSLFLELLQGMNQKDFRQILRLSTADFWNVSKDDIRLLERLKKTPLDKQLVICERLNTKDRQAFSHQKKRIVDLMKDYILLNKCKKEKVLRDSIIAEFCSKKALDKNYNKAIKSYKKSLLERPLDIDTGFLHYKYYELLATHSRTQRVSKQEFFCMEKALNCFSKDSQLRLSVEKINQEKITNITYEGKKINIQLDYPLHIQTTYQQLFILIQGNDSDEAYHFLKNTMLQESFILSNDEWKSIHTHLMNYLTKQTNQGKESYYKDYLLFIEYAIKKDFFLQNSRIDYGRYRNTFLIYLMTSNNDISKARQFIQEYFSYVNHPNPQFVRDIHLVYLLLLDSLYEEAENNLNKIDYRKLIDVHLQVFYRKLQLMLIYFRREKSDLYFEDSLKNFRSFLYKQDSLKGKIGDKQTTKLDVCLNFASLIKRLYTGKLKDLNIQNTELATTDRLWLKMQI